MPAFKMATRRGRCVAEELALFAFYGLTLVKKKKQESLCVSRGGALRAIERGKACGRALINTFDDNLLGLFWVRWAWSFVHKLTESPAAVRLGQGAVDRREQGCNEGHIPFREPHQSALGLGSTSVYSLP